MKKLCALLLSVIMAVSLTAPAFASGGGLLKEPVPAVLDPTSPQDIIAAYASIHPERVAELRDSAYADFEADEELSRGRTAEEYMKKFGMTEEEFLDEAVERRLFELYYAEGDEWIAELQKQGLIRESDVSGDGDQEAVPISAFLPEADNDFVIGIIGGQDGPTSIFTTPGVGNGLEYGDFEWWTADDEQALLDQMKEALGGVAGQVGVMVNGQYIQFPDAAPEVANGRTMVPVRALVEALGGEVDYQAGAQGDAVRLIIDGYAYEFVIGSTTVTVTPTSDNDKDTPKPGDIVMDCAPYIKGGRTYVPVRFISEALGYEVGWDNDFQTAILLDRDALAEEIDGQFTIMNRVQANRGPARKDGESYSTNLEGSLTVTAFDTLNGDQTYKMDLTGSSLMNYEAVNGTYSIELSDNIVDALAEALTEDEADSLRSTINGLKELEVILNREGLAWFHAPILDELGGEENVWCGCDLGMELNTLLSLQMNAADLTMGTAVTFIMDPNSVMNWITVDQTVQMMSALYSDDKFTTSNGASTLTIGVDELMAVYENLGITDLDEVKDVFKEYSITMKVDSKGGAVVTCVMETEAQSGMPGMKLTMDCTQSDGKAELTMNAHVANFGELELTLNATQKAASGKPATEPPAGASIVDAPELLNGYGE